MFCLHPALIGAIALGSVCILLYLCTVKSYLKGTKGTISQIANIVPMASLSPKNRSTGVAVFVIDVDRGANPKSDFDEYRKSPTLNLEALAKDGKALVEREGAGDADHFHSDSLTNLLVCDDRKCDKFTI